MSDTDAIRNYEFKNWGDLLTWVQGHERLFKKRGNPFSKRSTASDFKFSGSKWQQFYRLTNKEKFPFSLMAYTEIRVEGNLTYEPMSVRFITVTVGATGSTQEHALYNKKAWKQWKKSMLFDAQEKVFLYRDMENHAFNDEFDEDDE